MIKELCQKNPPELQKEAQTEKLINYTMGLQA